MLINKVCDNVPFRSQIIGKEKLLFACNYVIKIVRLITSFHIIWEILFLNDLRLLLSVNSR